VCVLPSPTPADDYDTDGIITPQAYGAHARAWAGEGADIIGGCCGVGPQHMAAAAAALSL
jgi:S-methylmethionine-dependent homocysteine/selenocysteine methylase